MSTPVPLAYNDLVTQVALLAPYQVKTTAGVVQGVAPEFTTLISQMLQYAEQRIQRDVELLATQVSNGYTLDPTTNQLQVPTGDFVTIQDLVVTISGEPRPLNPVSKAYLLTVWPASSAPGPPRVFAIQGGDAPTDGLTSTIVLLGPPPDQAYPAMVIGDTRGPSLATYANAAQAATQYTWISTWLPDLLVLACMIYVSAYQRDFGRQSDDPQMALSYESQYQTLLASVSKEEFRKRFQADAWSSQPTPPAATPTR